MSAAWKVLNQAVRTLVGRGGTRKRLYEVYVSDIALLREIDLPLEAREAFLFFRGAIPGCQPVTNKNKVKTHIDALSASEADQLISTVIEMYDAVTRYQPRPIQNRDEQ